MEAQHKQRARRAVIITALPAEFKAVRSHLKNIKEDRHPQGTVYDIGRFEGRGREIWSVAVVEAGAGNPSAAAEAERAIQRFDPEVLLFVGIAGGVKDVAIGDVVAATKVYGFESAKISLGYQARPDVGKTSYPMEQRARAEVRSGEWKRRIKKRADRGTSAFVGPIAAGEKVLANRSSKLNRFLASHLSDSLAIEMEGIGFLQAARMNPGVESLVVRGISDLLNAKTKAESLGSQDIAARNASAFAFEVLSKLGGRTSKPSTKPPTPRFRRDARVESLIRGIKLADWKAAETAAIKLSEQTSASGQNRAFEALLKYRDCPDEDALWAALMTIESCAELMPMMFDHETIGRLAEHRNFSVRSCAASVCMRLAQFAPAHVPFSILTGLSKYDEDWYVQAPANAALKAMARSMPVALGLYYIRLRSRDSAEREHAAMQVEDVARLEPELLDWSELAGMLRHAAFLGDRVSVKIVKRALARVRRSQRRLGYKYGI